MNKKLQNMHPLFLIGISGLIITGITHILSSSSSTMWTTLYIVWNVLWTIGLVFSINKSKPK